MSDKKGNEGGFMKFLYNGDTGEVLGRTGMSWAKIIIFYIIFYACLAAFFGVLLYIFYTTLDQERPKYEQGESLIGTNPGVGFRPQPDQDKNVDSTLIWFKKSDPSDYQFWSNQLHAYLNTSRNVEGGIPNCNFNGTKTTDKDGCKFVTDLMPEDCKTKESFGYHEGNPCILFKLNRIYGWKPKAYNYKNGDQFDLDTYRNSLKAAELPQDLQDQIERIIRPSGRNPLTPKMQAEIASSVWIWCNGENPADRENMGKLQYGSFPGIPSYYFPFKKQKNYVSPFVMVQFQKPSIGVLVNIECKAYAANIFPDRTTRTGSVHFEFMIEN